MHPRPLLFALCLLCLGWLAACTTPSQPTCGGDDDCVAPARCLNGACTQCSDDAHCGGPCARCSPDGTCEPVPGCCATNNDCPSGTVCRNNSCRHQCDAETPCPAGQDCEGGRCVKFCPCPGAGCAPGQTCGRCGCEAISLCKYQNIYFDFDESGVRNDQKAAITQNVNCMADRAAKLDLPSHVKLVGHTDELGSEAYNLALGKRRADTIQGVLVTKLRVQAAQVTTDSRGLYEPVERCGCGNAKNRRVTFLPID
jgi:peptidoglycan-associated lipoprotein